MTTEWRDQCPICGHVFDGFLTTAVCPQCQDTKAKEKRHTMKMHEHVNHAGYHETIMEHEQVERIRFTVLDMERPNGHGDRFFAFEQRYLNLGDGPQWHVRHQAGFSTQTAAVAYATGELDTLAGA